MVSMQYLMVPVFRHRFTSGSLVFRNFPSDKLRWPLTFIYNNRDYLMNVDHQHSKCEIHGILCSWDIMSTGFWPFDSWWRQWNLVTAHDLEPSTKAIQIIHLIWAIRTPSMRFMEVSVLEITSLQGYNLSTSGDWMFPKEYWFFSPLTKYLPLKTTSNCNSQIWCFYLSE